MKKILLSAALLASMTTAFAQTEILNLQLKSGETVLYPVSDIEKITFTEAQEIASAYSFKFSDCKEMLLEKCLFAEPQQVS